MDFDKLRNILNLLFIILTVTAIVIYFKLNSEDIKIFAYVCGAAIIVKVIEIFIRFTHR